MTPRDLRKGKPPRGGEPRGGRVTGWRHSDCTARSPSTPAFMRLVRGCGMSYPRISCILTIPVPLVGEQRQANLRRAARDCPVVPAGAIVRLRIGAAETFVETEVPLIADRLRRAQHVEVEGDDVATALGLHSALLTTWSSEVVA